MEATREVVQASNRISKLREHMGRIGVAMVCAIPPADTALSDRYFGGLSNYLRDSVNPSGNPLINKSLQFSLLSSAIFLESMALVGLITKTKTVRDSYNNYEEYVENKRSNMSLVRRAISKVANSPFTAIGSIGERIQNKGKRVEDMSFKHSEKIGNLISDIGVTNAIGTSGLALNESMSSDNKGMTFRRAARVCGIFTASWLPLSESVRYGYRGLGKLGEPGQLAQNVVGATGRGIELLTTVDPGNIGSTLPGTIFMSIVAASFLKSGYEIAASNEVKQS
jgi:hypothetical protein